MKRHVVPPDFPLQSDPMNDTLDDIFAQVVDLVGHISPSGTVDITGLYDDLDDLMTDQSSSAITDEEERAPSSLQLITEFHNTRAHDPEKGR